MVAARLAYVQYSEPMREPVSKEKKNENGSEGHRQVCSLLSTGDAKYFIYIIIYTYIHIYVHICINSYTHFILILTSDKVYFC